MFNPTSEPITAWIVVGGQLAVFRSVVSRDTTTLLVKQDPFPVSVEVTCSAVCAVTVTTMVDNTPAVTVPPLMLCRGEKER